MQRYNDTVVDGARSNAESQSDDQILQDTPRVFGKSSKIRSQDSDNHLDELCNNTHTTELVLEVNEYLVADIIAKAVIQVSFMKSVQNSYNPVSVCHTVVE